MTVALASAKVPTTSGMRHQCPNFPVSVACATIFPFIARSKSSLLAPAFSPTFSRSAYSLKK